MWYTNRQFECKEPWLFRMVCSLWFGIVFDNVNWNSIKHRLRCGSYENLTCIRMDTLFFHRLSMQIDTQRGRSCDANPSIMCTFADDFSHIEMSINQPTKETHTKNSTNTTTFANWKLCLVPKIVCKRKLIDEDMNGNRIHISTCFDWNDMTE